MISPSKPALEDLTSPFECLQACRRLHCHIRLQEKRIGTWPWQPYDACQIGAPSRPHLANATGLGRNCSIRRR